MQSMQIESLVYLSTDSKSIAYYDLVFAIILVPESLENNHTETMIYVKLPKTIIYYQFLYLILNR